MNGFKYAINDIEWDTREWTEACELATGQCVPDLPENIDEVEFDREMDEDTLFDWLEARFGFPATGFDYTRIY